MNIWFGEQGLRQMAQQSAVTIGNFDGVHRGHLHILQRLQNEARARGLRSVVVVFEPQANEFFAKMRDLPAVSRLTPLRDKLRLLRDSGCVDDVLVLRFNAQFAAIEVNDFIEHFLRQGLQTRYLLVGDDFRFGRGRVGDFDLLAAQNDFVTERTPSVLVAGTRASSTAVRQSLQAGKIEQAQHILGHEYVLNGRVKHGKKLGRTINCPTANIHLAQHNYALNGVFVVDVSGDFGRKRGVASLGVNPTVADGTKQKLEVHIFDFHQEIYGQRLSVHFLHKLRDEEKFADLDSMMKQIYLDMDAARAWCREEG
ncbi:MAG: bifunctional riboflavin kinase/FAD synthetase [Neisseria sp.]|nr:bifunctional riboflavin kinase/FAD synthetase [Neisseria sp.]